MASNLARCQHVAIFAHFTEITHTVIAAILKGSKYNRSDFLSPKINMIDLVTNKKTLLSVTLEASSSLQFEEKVCRPFGNS